MEALADDVGVNHIALYYYLNRRWMGWMRIRFNEENGEITVHRLRGF